MATFINVNDINRHAGFLYNKAHGHFPHLCSFCRFDGSLITYVSKQGDRTVDLFKMVFFSQRPLGLPSKCCDWGMANNFKQGFSFLLSSPGLTWLERFCPHHVSPRHKHTQPSLCTPVISFLSSHALESRRCVRILLIIPQEAGGYTQARFCVMFENTQHGPKGVLASI